MAAPARQHKKRSWPATTPCLVQTESTPGLLSRRFLAQQAIVIEIKDVITREVANGVVEQMTNAMHRGASLVFVWIHSNGGSVYEALRIVHAMERAKQAGLIVSTVVDSVAFSVAVPILCSGSVGYRFVSPYAKVMIHRPRLSRRDERSAEPQYSPSVDLHLDALCHELETIILANLGTSRFRHRRVFQLKMQDAIARQEDWFLDVPELLFYGLADHSQLPRLHHHVEYRSEIVLPR